MSRAERSYVRIYYVDLQRDYPDIYFDPTALSTWIRLLVLVDQSWPAMPELPRAVRRADLELLVRVGLVVLESNHRFAIKGYDAERGKRQRHAQVAAAGRWGNAPSDAPSTAQRVPRPNPKPRTESEADSEASDESTTPPPPSPARGLRENGTSPRQLGDQPRANGSNPRAAGESPRQEREALKRGPTRLGDILGEVERRQKVAS